MKERLPHWLEKNFGLAVSAGLGEFTGWLNPLARGQMSGLGFEPSVLLVGAGMITGLRVSLSMFAGSALLYYVVAPLLVAHDAAGAGIAGFIPSFHRAANGNFNPTRWALWGGTAVMVFSSLAQVALNWRTVLRAFMVFKKSERAAAHDPAAAIEVPNSWLFIGLVRSPLASSSCNTSPFTSPSGWGWCRWHFPLSCRWYAAARRARRIPRPSARWAKPRSCSMPCCPARKASPPSISWPPARPPPPPGPPPIC